MNRTIAVFDSGVGGLTVLHALKRRWPQQDFLYLADTARLPYGGKSLQTIHQYVKQNIDYLLKFDPKAIVVACNSGSTALLERPLSCPVPLLNVVEPGARVAAATTASGRIGVLGTRATVLSQAYVRAIHQRTSSIAVFQQACPLLVPLVEEGWMDDPVTNLIVYRYVSALLPQQIDTLILGCTHYPALRGAIQRATGNGVTLVDSGLGLVDDLEALKICREGADLPAGLIHFHCTDYSPRLEETLRVLLPATPIESIEVVNLN